VGVQPLQAPGDRQRDVPPAPQLPLARRPAGPARGPHWALPQAHCCEDYTLDTTLDLLEHYSYECWQPLSFHVVETMACRYDQRAGQALPGPRLRLYHRNSSAWGPARALDRRCMARSGDAISAPPGTGADPSSRTMCLHAVISRQHAGTGALRACLSAQWAALGRCSTGGMRPVPARTEALPTATPRRDAPVFAVAQLLHEALQLLLLLL
jgi:hypothetical protein